MADVLIPHELHRQIAYEAVASAADYITNKPYPGAERWQILLRCANLVAPYDHDLGREYYERGLLAAEGLDDDSALLLRFQADLAHVATHIGSADERRQIAARLVRLVEAQEPYVSETSALPREQVLETVTFLDPPAGFALCSRWDDENRVTLDDSIPRVVRTALAVGFLSAADGLPLLRLAGERFDISEDAVRILESLYELGPSARPNLLEAVKVVSSWICRDVPLLSRQVAASRIVAWADSRGLASLAGIADLRSLADFAAGLRAEQHRPARLRDDPEREQTLQKLLAHATHVSLADVEADLRIIWRNSFDPEPIVAYVENLRRATPTSQRLAMLETLSGLGADEMLGPAIARALERLLVDFRNSPPVRDWAPRAITEFLQAALPALLSEYRDRGEIEALLGSPPLVNESPATLLLPSIIRHLPDLGPPDLYKLARLITRKLPTTDVSAILRWSLGRLEDKIRADGRDLPAIDLPPISRTVAGVMARFLWVLFGHPDKLVRWRALHAARGLVLAGGTGVLSELAQLSRTRSAEPFGSPSREFYWLSARVWLLILFLRVAYEQPAAVREHLGLLVEHALDPTLPHAQIRELARRSALRVLGEFPSLMPQDTVSALQSVNESRACLYPREPLATRRPRRDRTRDRRDRGRFSFWMDTEDYWFPALNQVFGYPDVDVRNRAERWIVDTWGRTNEDWWHDPRELSGRYESRELYHRRDSVPDIETLRVYLEYHAMCCSAGEMIDTLPIAVDVHDDGPTDSWNDWLSEQLPWRDNYWVAEVRAPTPFRSDCWGQFGELDEWLETVGDSEYDAGLGLEENGHVGQLVVLGHHEFGDDRRRGTVRVSSALVTPATAGSLMCALQTTDPNDLILPRDGIWQEDATISVPGFELTPWLRDERHEEGLDRYDPLGRIDISSLSSFGEDFLSCVGARASQDGLQFRDSNGRAIGRLELWNDLLDKEREIGVYSTGERLWVKVDTLLHYLRCRDRDLIIEVTIARNRSERRQRLDSEKYDLGRDRIYLLRRDGTLETLAGRRTLGGTART